MPPVLSRFHESSPPGHGGSCGAAWVVVGGDTESKRRCAGGDSRLCRHKARLREHFETDKPLIARGDLRDSAARCDSWRFGRPAAFSLAREMARTAPKRRLRVVEAISIFYNNVSYMLERSSEHPISMEGATAV